MCKIVFTINTLYVYHCPDDKQVQIKLNFNAVTLKKKKNIYFKMSKI